MEFKNYFLTAMALSSLALMPQMAKGQATSSTYFLNNFDTRHNLNPALTPERGYFKVPLINLDASVSSNAINIDDVREMIENDGAADYFTDSRFIKKLKNENSVTVNLTNDILSFGWFKGKGFWSVNASVKAEVNGIVPRSMFEFLRDTRGFNELEWNHYNRNIENLDVNLNAYLETGVGYAHPIGKRLTVGGKVKMLFGIANSRVKIDRIAVNTNIEGIEPNQNWKDLTAEQISRLRGQASIETRASAEAAFAGYKMTMNKDGFFDDFKREGSFGVSGMGMGIDLGAEYKVLDNLTVSAAVLDLGFITWSDKYNTKYSSESYTAYDFNNMNSNDAREFVDLMGSGKLVNTDMLKISDPVSQKRTTSLHSTILMGADYRLLNDKLSLGALYTIRTTQPKTMSKITLSSAYSLTKQVGFSIAYNYSNLAGSGFGFGIKAGPLLLSTDYMYFGKNAKSVNAMLSFVAPLGKKKR